MSGVHSGGDGKEQSEDNSELLREGFVREIYEQTHRLKIGMLLLNLG